MQLILLLGILSHACGPLAAIPTLIFAARELAAIDAGLLPEANRKTVIAGRWLALAGLVVSAMLAVLAALIWLLRASLLESWRLLLG